MLIKISSIEEAVKASREAIEKSSKNALPFPTAKSDEQVVKETMSLQAYLFINSPYRYTWYCAGIGTGKSWVLARYMFDRIWDNWETVGLVAANTHTQLTQSTLPHLFKLLDEYGIRYVVNKTPPASWGSRNLFKKSYQNVISVLVAKGKVAHILTRTLHNYKAIRGVTIGWAALDEIADTKVDAWKEIGERLRCPLSHKLQILVAGMPDLPGDNWTWEVFNPDDPVVKQNYKVIFQASTEAKHLDWAEYLKPLLQSLSPLEAMQRIFARIVIDQSGRVYYCYEDGVNNVSKYEYDEYRELFFEIDFNILSHAPASATVRQEFTADDGVIETQVLDEISLEGKTTIEVCNAFLARYGGHKARGYVFGDNTGNLNRTISEFQHIKNTLYPRFGNNLLIPYLKSNPEIGQRTAAVNAMLRNGFGRPRLFVAPHCKELIEDFRKLMPKDGKIDKSDAKRSHMSDALGYGIWFRFPPFDAKKGSREINAYV